MGDSRLGTGLDEDVSVSLASARNNVCYFGTGYVRFS